MKTNQVNIVLNHLNDFESITSLEAFRDYGITRLSAIIYILRHKYALNIVSDTLTIVNRYGNTTSYAKYKLIKEEGVSK